MGAFNGNGGVGKERSKTYETSGPIASLRIRKANP